jgi:hypothetical protein
MDQAWTRQIPQTLKAKIGMWLRLGSLGEGSLAGHADSPASSDRKSVNYQATRFTKDEGGGTRAVYE